MLSGAVDTSIGISLAVADGDKVIINHRQRQSGRGGGRQLAAVIHEQLREAEINIAEISRWTGGTGPGSFSGIRIGLAFVLGVCRQSAAHSRGLPSSLAAAISFQERIEENALIGVLHQAGREQLIFSPYRKVKGKIQEADSARVLAAENKTEILEQCSLLISPQSETIRDDLSPVLQERLLDLPTIDVSAFFQHCQWPSSPEERAASLQPRYLSPFSFQKKR